MRDPLEVVRELLRLNEEAKNARDVALDAEPPPGGFKSLVFRLSQSDAIHTFAQSERALGCGDLKTALPALCDELERLREFFGASERYRNICVDEENAVLAYLESRDRWSSAARAAADDRTGQIARDAYAVYRTLQDAADAATQAAVEALYDLANQVARLW